MAEDLRKTDLERMGGKIEMREGLRRSPEAPRLY